MKEINQIDGKTLKNAWTEVVYTQGNAPEYITHLEAKIRILEYELAEHMGEDV